MNAMKHQITLTALLISALLLVSCEKKPAPLAQNPQNTETEVENVDPCFLPLANGEKELLGKGNNIISAVEAYRAENGGFPESLGELVPRYITEIPTTGRKRTYLLSFKIENAVFNYWHSNADFSISVRYSTFDEWYYSSKTGLWEYKNH